MERETDGQNEAGTSLERGKAEEEEEEDARRAIPGAVLNESAFLCLAMLSKHKHRPIIYHPLRKQHPALPGLSNCSLE